jgi:hypothetical protein
MHMISSEVNEKDNYGIVAPKLMPAHAELITNLSFLFRSTL